MAVLKSGTTIDGSIVWHAGNDGPGSTLDADTLDGQHASEFAPISHNHAASEITSGTFLDARISQSSVTQHITKTLIDGLNVDADTLDGIDSANFLRSNVADTWTGKLTWGGGASAGLSFGSYTAQLIDLYQTGYGIGIQSSTAYVRTNSRFSIHQGGVHDNAQNSPGTGGTNIFTVTSTEITHVGNTIWTAANDGPGSSLDADTVDGLHAADLAGSGHNHDAAYVNVSGDSMTGDLLLTHNTANIVLGSSATSGDRLRLHRNSTTNYIDYATGTLLFRAGGSGAALALTPTSRVGIGTSTPEELLDVAGNMRVREENAAKFGGVGAADAAFAIQYNATTESLDFNYLGA